MTRYATTNSPWSIGFENVFRELAEVHSAMAHDNYPPHNIVKVDDDNYVVELAVAGFRENELDVLVQDGILTVTGAITDRPVPNYVHKGISTRTFQRSWKLSDYVEVTQASYSSGILSIELKRVLPEAKRPRKISINADKNPGDARQFLSE